MDAVSEQGRKGKNEECVRRETDWVTEGQKRALNLKGAAGKRR